MVSDITGRAVVEDSPTWLRVTWKNSALEVSGGGRRVDGLRLAPGDTGFLRLNGREYPGALEIIRSGDALTVINELPLEEYLAGAVKAEAGDKMPIEMLKAQAVVARTYAAYHRRLNAEKAFHLVASTLNQQYIGRVATDSPVWAAVNETAGQVLLWNGELFPAFYHTDSGGHPEDPRVVFATGNMPALQPVRVEFPRPRRITAGLVCHGRSLGPLRGADLGGAGGDRVLERSSTPWGGADRGPRPRARRPGRGHRPAGASRLRHAKAALRGVWRATVARFAVADRPGVGPTSGSAKNNGRTGLPRTADRSLYTGRVIAPSRRDRDPMSVRRSEHVWDEFTRGT